MCSPHPWGLRSLPHRQLRNNQLTFICRAVQRNCAQDYYRISTYLQTMVNRDQNLLIAALMVVAGEEFDGEWVRSELFFYKWQKTI